MKNPMDTFLLVFVVVIMIVGLVVSINAQRDLREFRYMDDPGINVSNIG